MKRTYSVRKMIKTFKDFVMEDLDVFFTGMEFAEEHQLDDEPLLCIVIENKREDYQKNNLKDFRSATEKVFVDRRTVYVKTEDFFIPEIGAVISLDNENFDVIDAAEESGVVRIELSRNES